MVRTNNNAKVTIRLPPTAVQRLTRLAQDGEQLRRLGVIGLAVQSKAVPIGKKKRTRRPNLNLPGPEPVSAFSVASPSTSMLAVETPSPLTATTSVPNQPTLSSIPVQSSLSTLNVPRDKKQPLQVDANFDPLNTNFGREGFLSKIKENSSIGAGAGDDVSLMSILPTIPSVPVSDIFSSYVPISTISDPVCSPDEPPTKVSYINPAAEALAGLQEKDSLDDFELPDALTPSALSSSDFSPGASERIRELESQLSRIGEQQGSLHLNEVDLPAVDTPCLNSDLGVSSLSPSQLLADDPAASPAPTTVSSPALPVSDAAPLATESNTVSEPTCTSASDVSQASELVEPTATLLSAATPEPVVAEDAVPVHTDDRPSSVDESSLDKMTTSDLEDVTITVSSSSREPSPPVPSVQADTVVQSERGAAAVVDEVCAESPAAASNVVPAQLGSSESASASTAITQTSGAWDHTYSSPPPVLHSKTRAYVNPRTRNPESSFGLNLDESSAFGDDVEVKELDSSVQSSSSVESLCHRPFKKREKAVVEPSAPNPTADDVDGGTLASVESIQTSGKTPATDIAAVPPRSASADSDYIADKIVFKPSSTPARKTAVIAPFVKKPKESKSTQPTSSVSQLQRSNIDELISSAVSGQATGSSREQLLAALVSAASDSVATPSLSSSNTFRGVDSTLSGLVDGLVDPLLQLSTALNMTALSQWRSFGALVAAASSQAAALSGSQSRSTAAAADAASSSQENLLRATVELIQQQSAAACISPYLQQAAAALTANVASKQGLSEKVKTSSEVPSEDEIEHEKSGARSKRKRKPAPSLEVSDTTSSSSSKAKRARKSQQSGDVSSSKKTQPESSKTDFLSKTTHRGVADDKAKSRSRSSATSTPTSVDSTSSLSDPKSPAIEETRTRSGRTSKAPAATASLRRASRQPRAIRSTSK